MDKLRIEPHNGRVLIARFVELSGLFVQVAEVELDDKAVGGRLDQVFE